MVGKYINESNLINTSFDCEYLNLLASDKINQTGKINFSKLLGFCETWVKLLFILIKNRPDSCYFAITVSGYAFYRDLLLIFLLKIFRINLIYHMHNKGVSDKSNIFLHLCYLFMYKNTHVILLSKYLYSDVENYVPKAKVHICPNGIPDFKIHDKTAKTKDNVVRLLFLSNLIESKGIFILLDSLAIINQKGINFRCDIIGGEGDISEDKLVEYLKKSNLEDRVFYLGKKYGKDKHRVFLKSDIFVFPTFYSKECFPLVSIEAMKYAKPVISTNEGGLRDIVEDGITGYIVPQRNINLLVEKILELMGDPEKRYKMGKAGRYKYENEFKLNIFENRLLIILLKSVN